MAFSHEGYTNMAFSHEGYTNEGYTGIGFFVQPYPTRHPSPTSEEEALTSDQR